MRKINGKSECKFFTTTSVYWKYYTVTVKIKRVNKNISIFF